MLDIILPYIIVMCLLRLDWTDVPMMSSLDIFISKVDQSKGNMLKILSKRGCKE